MDENDTDDTDDDFDNNTKEDEDEASTKETIHKAVMASCLDWGEFKDAMDKVEKSTDDDSQNKTVANVIMTGDFTMDVN